MYMEWMNSVVLTLWVSGSVLGGASTSNGDSGGTMVVSGKDEDRRMGVAGNRDVLAPGVGGTLGNGVVCRSGVA